MYHPMREILIYFSLKNNGSFRRVFRDLENKEKPVINAIIKVKNLSDDETFKCLVITDEDYPDMLKQHNNPPFVIYYQNKDRNAVINEINEFLSQYKPDDKEIDNQFIQPYFKSLAIIPEELKEIQKEINDLIKKDQLNSLN